MDILHFPFEVAKQFDLYCVHQQAYKKDAFNEMCQQFLEKHQSKKFKLKDRMGKTTIKMDDLKSVNFEVEKEVILKVHEMKVIHQCSLKSLYAQIIIHFFDDNPEKLKN